MSPFLDFMDMGQAAIFSLAPQHPPRRRSFCFFFLSFRQSLNPIIYQLQIEEDGSFNRWNTSVKLKGPHFTFADEKVFVARPVPWGSWRVWTELL